MPIRFNGYGKGSPELIALSQTYASDVSHPLTKSDDGDLGKSLALSIKPNCVYAIARQTQLYPQHFVHNPG